MNYIVSKKLVTYAKKNLELITMIKNTKKSEIIVITLGNIETLLIMFVFSDTKTPTEIPVVFHNGSKYVLNNDFII